MRWAEIEQLVAKVTVTDAFHQNISQVRHPMGILMHIIQRESDARENDAVWAPDVVQGAARQIRQLVYGNATATTVPSAVGQHEQMAPVLGRETAVV